MILKISEKSSNETESEIDYDLDSEDEKFIEANKHLYADLTEDNFERIIDRLEKESFKNVINKRQKMI